MFCFFFLYLFRNMEGGEVENCGKVSERKAAPAVPLGLRLERHRRRFRTDLMWKEDQIPLQLKLQTRCGEPALGALMAQRFFGSVLELDRKVLRSRVSAPDHRGSCCASAALRRAHPAAPTRRRLRKHQIVCPPSRNFSRRSRAEPDPHSSASSWFYARERAPGERGGGGAISAGP